MIRSLRNISISHTSTSLEQRENYHVSAEAIRPLSQSILCHFSDIVGLMILSTCNRTEVYFESTSTSALDMCEYFITIMCPKAELSSEKKLFHFNNRTIDTAFHLLEVANGLRSAVVGDQQILNQIKGAYKVSLEHHTQGSLLERTLQAVFKSHKRISNESAFRNGSRSTAYRALKIIQDSFGKDSMPSKRLLIIGAGEITTEILKYLPKFAFEEIAISNRTEMKAMHLAQAYHLKTEKWSNIENNHFHSFDAIITAVSNRKHLIKSLPQVEKKIIIDLSLPCNAHPALAFQHNIELYNLDNVTEQIAQTDYSRQQAVHQAESIIAEEINKLANWVQKAKIRSFLKDYKASTQHTLREVIEQLQDKNLSTKDLENIIHIISEKMVKKPAVIMNHSCEGELSENSMEFIQKAFAPNNFFS
ncbi:glutamyl-tRNA reductase [Fulvivirga sediminis]|uniref:Glutamyl-tRNA reductase n=1 Tax=Fulvivirga sediminis TaxID=2803949 RepID=A0A937K294_9BACT|nr:glutamyl-tRNA reductase [Fulvivirga sediminis]MBL3657552.1 glutamyl-tRNA reductase [Fulvivirga sediminis]